MEPDKEEQKDHILMEQNIRILMEKHNEETKRLESENHTLQHHCNNLIQATVSLEHHVSYWKSECATLRQNQEDQHHVAVNFELVLENKELKEQLAKAQQQRDNFRQLWLNSINVTNELKTKLEEMGERDQEEVDEGDEDFLKR